MQIKQQNISRTQSPTKQSLLYTCNVVYTEKFSTYCSSYLQACAQACELCSSIYKVNQLSFQKKDQGFFYSPPFYFIERNTVYSYYLFLSFSGCPYNTCNSFDHIKNLHRGIPKSEKNHTGPFSIHKRT